MATNALLKSAVRHHNHGASNLARERLSVPADPNARLRANLTSGLDCDSMQHGFID